MIRKLNKDGSNKKNWYKPNRLYFVINCSVFFSTIIHTETEETLDEKKKIEDPLEGCDLPVNTLALSKNKVIYNSRYDIGGFQFNIQDALISKASGGDAEKSGFTTSFGKNVILSFSFEGKVIPAGCGILLNLETDQTPLAIKDIVVSSIKGKELFFKYHKK